VCRLNGTVTPQAGDAGGGGSSSGPDTYEGLYPEGDFRATPGKRPGTVDVELRDVNLDPRLLVGRLLPLADAGTLHGSIEVRSFDDRRPDDCIRLLFQD
jgi:hypothetical protein